METHPLKTFVSIMAGLIGGTSDLVNKTLSISNLSMEAALDLFIACGKAALIGGAAWAGQTIAIYFRKKILLAWATYKTKK